MNGALGERLIHQGNGAMLLGWGLPRFSVSGVGCHERQPAAKLLG